MLDISRQTKELYRENSVEKQIIFNFYGIDSLLYPENSVFPSALLLPNTFTVPKYSYGLEHVISSSLNITEGLYTGNTMSFKSCVSSKMTVEMFDIEDVYNLWVEVVLSIDGSEEGIVLFNGVVDSCPRQTNRKRRKLTCYDFLYYRYDVDILEWYRAQTFPISVKNFRKKLALDFNMVYEDQELCNDDMILSMVDDLDKLNGRDLIKMLAEFNGTFAHVNRKNKISFVSLDKRNYLYPSESVYPGSQLYPNIQDLAYNGFDNVDTVISCKWSDFMTQEINVINVKNKNNVLITSFGSGINAYEIKDNLFFKSIAESSYQAALENLYNHVGGIAYIIHQTETKGRPYLECGDMISVKVDDGKILNTYIMSRTLKGCQSLRDTYKATGEEYHEKLYAV